MEDNVELREEKKRGKRLFMFRATNREEPTPARDTTQFTL
jgi:hypothetical protein